jgi:hypothetical protein
MCTQPNFPKGKPEQLVIFSEGLPRVKEYIIKGIQDTFYTPQPEPFYSIIFADNKDLEKYKGYYTIMVIATPYSGSYKVLKQLFPEVKNKGIYRKRGVFQKGDFITAIFGSSEESVLWKLREGIIYEILRHIKELYKSHVYNIIDINNSIKREIKQKYGFTFDVPTGFLYIEKAKDFVALGTHYPDRFIFIYNTKKEIPFDAMRIMDIRDSLTAIYYKGDKIDRELTKWKEVEIFNERAIKIYGHWENEEMRIGGAFESFFFRKKDRYYLVDLGVFEPEKPKLKYIRWLEAIVSTITWN